MDSLGNLFQDFTVLPVEKFFLISNLNLPKLQFKTIGTYKTGRYQEEYFFLPTAVQFTSHIYSVPSMTVCTTGKECLLFFLGRSWFKNVMR